MEMTDLYSKMFSVFNPLDFMGNFEKGAKIAKNNVKFHNAAIKYHSALVEMNEAIQENMELLKV